MISSGLFSQERPKTPSTPTLNITDTCKLDFPKIKSAFVQDDKLYKAFYPPEKDSRTRTLKQGVILTNGTQIRMIKSGCAHYIYLLNIRPNAIKSKKSDYLFDLAVEQIKLIPVEKDEEFNMTIILNALDEKNRPLIKFDRDIYTLPCPDAFCTLRAVRQNGAPVSLEIIYDKTL